MIGVTAATVLLSLGWSLAQDDVYTGKVVVLVREDPADVAFGTGAGGVGDENAMDTARRVLEGELVAARVTEALDLDGAPPDVKGSISEDSNVLEISVEAGDATSAADLANEYAQALIDERREEATADLLEVSSGLDRQVAAVEAQIQQVTDQLAEQDDTVQAEVAEKEAEIAELRTAIAARQAQLVPLNAATELTAAERAQQETLNLEISTLQQQVEDLTADVDELETTDDGVLEAERERLLTQRSVLAQRSSELQAASAIQSGGAQIVRTATPPSAPSSPKPVNAAILGLFAGLLLGMGAAFLRDYFDDSVTSPDDLDKLDEDLPLLAVVPVIPASKGRSVGIARPESTGLEAFRSLRTNIEFLAASGDHRVIEIISAQPDEGKTTVAANLAVVLAQAGSSVVLVDADLRAPRQHRIFRVEGETGLSNLLIGAPTEAALQQVDTNLSVIVAGAVPPNPSELLGSRRMGALIDELRHRFDYVILDAAPLLPVADGLAVARHVDGVIVIAQSGRTTTGPLQQALSALKQVSAPVLGLVLNRVDPRTAASNGYTNGSEYGAKSTLPPEQLRPSKDVEPAPAPPAQRTPSPTKPVTSTPTKPTPSSPSVTTSGTPTPSKPAPSPQPTSKPAADGAVAPSRPTGSETSPSTIRR